jgi:hypothetical protein
MRDTYLPAAVNDFIIAPVVPVNPLGQLLETVGCYGAALVLFAVAIRRSWRGQYLGLGCLLGAAVLSLGEAIYDKVYHLVFYTEGQWTFWTALGVPQPVWVIAAYVLAYGCGGWWVAERVSRGGVTRRALAMMTAWIWLACTIFETAAFHLGAYEYFGDQPLRVLGFPWWITMANAAFIVSTGIAVGGLQPILRNTRAAVQVVLPAVLYPVAFCGITYGTSFAAVDVLNTGLASGPWMTAAAVAANLLTLLALLLAVDLLSFAPDHRASLSRWLLRPARPNVADTDVEVPASRTS